ncbi:MAG: isoprenyl transferase [Bacteroidetes bacterium 4484_249]|nr:MAG: isoprenyl transferase [Bacteroidetes bacterium 4484_249]
MSWKDKIDKEKLPQHVAIIMDGNGRWAKQRGKLRIFGHNNGVKSVRETAEAAAELGIKYLTLFAFSTENWNRPQAEVNALMKLLVKTINKEIKTLHDNDIRLMAIGNLESLPEVTRIELAEAIKETSHHKKMAMILALSYSSRWEIVDAVKKIANKVASGDLSPDKIDRKIFESYLTTNSIPDPELLIRTSGEFRISNFLLWQIAYTELYFTPKLWPDFRKEDLYEAIVDFQKRERRFGKTSEQIT